MRTIYPWQHELWQRLAGMRARLPHALLLKGPQGIGKLDLAFNLAQSMLCEQPLADGMACEDCPSCHWFRQESHPDFRLLQPEILSVSDDGIAESGKKPARQITVDQVRALEDFSNLSAHRGGYRVVLIHPAEAMNANAANALLKTLEEPQGKMLFLLVTHKPQQLLPTILSRCHAVPVSMPSLDASSSWLKQQGITDPAAMLAQSGFAPLLAMQLAEDETSTEERDLFLQAIMHPDNLDEFALAEQLKNRRTEPIKVIQWLQQWCYDLGSVQQAGKVRYHIAHVDLIKSVSNKVPMFNLLQYQKELVVAKREALHPLEPKLLFESLLLAYRQMLRANAKNPA